VDANGEPVTLKYVSNTVSDLRKTLNLLFLIPDYADNPKILLGSWRPMLNKLLGDEIFLRALSRARLFAGSVSAGGGSCQVTAKVVKNSGKVRGKMRHWYSSS
jgi:hypothetical protein